MLNDSAASAAPPDLGSSIDALAGCVRIDWDSEPRSAIERQIRHAYLCACYDDPTQTGYTEIASLYGSVEAMLSRAPSDVREFIAFCYKAEERGRVTRGYDRMVAVMLGVMENAQAEAAVSQMPPELYPG